MKRNAQSFIAAKIEDPGKPGAIVPMGPDGKRAGFSHACPCGCGKWSFVRINPENWAPGTTPMWSCAGDDLHLTLSPSIGIKPLVDGVYHWHGYLKNGVFEEL